uniref:Kazrin N-terminal domain-containing protein n=1 Tax=Pavo cristatus TaxID=9049 RepID=A0A8C9FGQ4_PAVCR
MESLRLEMTPQITRSNHQPTPTMPTKHVPNKGAGVSGFISPLHFQQQHEKRCFSPLLYSCIQHEAAHKPHRIKQHCTTENQSHIVWNDGRRALPCLSFPTQHSPAFLSASFRGLFASFAFLPGQDKPLLRRVTSGWSPAGPCMAAMQRGVGTRRGTAAGSGGTRGSVGRAGWNPTALLREEVAQLQEEVHLLRQMKEMLTKELEETHGSKSPEVLSATELKVQLAQKEQELARAKEALQGKGCLSLYSMHPITPEQSN